MFKGKADSAASTAQPQSEKSTTQRMGDALSGNHNQDQVRRGRGAGRGVDADAVFGDAAVAHAEGEERDGARGQPVKVASRTMAVFSVQTYGAV